MTDKNTPANPVHLLEAQVRTLTASFQVQQQTLQQLSAQTEKLEALLAAARATAAAPAQPGNQPLSVSLTSVDLSFGGLVGLWIKVMLASIPAALIVGVLWFIVFGLFSGTLMSLLLQSAVR